MLSNLSKQTTLACFSPPVMIATFLIEISLAVYVIWRYKLDRVTRIAAGILLTLATFQLAEYNVCEGSFGLTSLDWARVGFVAITLLPPLGIHLAMAMAGQLRRFRWALIGLYSIAAMFIISLMYVSHGLQGDVCLGNYVIFEVAPMTMSLYALYYYGLLLFGIWLALYFGQNARNIQARTAQYALIIGYLSFLVPTTTVNLLDPSSITGIPSIMCGFAVLLAIVLCGYVLPAHHATSIKKKKGKR